MARFWPARLPPEIESNILRSAERRVYGALSSALDDSWTVFYSRPWLGLTTTGEEIDGEADFIVAHPDRGYLAIEVKGGTIEYAPKSDSWTSTDRYHVTHPIKNPVAQARTAKHRVLEKLIESSYWRPHWVRIRHGVIFTDTKIPRRDFGLDMPRRIFCDREELEAGLLQWVEGRFGDREESDRAVQPLGADGLRALTKLLAEPYHFRVPLGNLIADDDSDLELLTQRQFQILDFLEHVPRAAVRGGAGTGKTVLAAESARRLFARNFRVLLLCYNRPLSFFLRQRIGDGPEIFSFHRFCSRMASDAGLEPPEKITERELFEECLPDLLFEAAAVQQHQRYDAIVVDEGQDFRPHWWPAIDAWLKPGGRLQVFHDCNQRLYGDCTVLPKDISAIPFSLNRNLRNTRTIHDVTMRHYSGEPILDNCVPGVPPEVVLVRDIINGKSRIIEAVAQLIERERVGPEQISVLGATEATCRTIVTNGLIGRWVATPCDERREGAIVVDTIRRFKGLESRVVVLLVTPEMTRGEELMYVATSRARAHLIVVGPSELTSIVMGKEI